MALSNHLIDNCACAVSMVKLTLVLLFMVHNAQSQLSFSAENTSAGIAREERDVEKNTLKNRLSNLDTADQFNYEPLRMLRMKQYNDLYQYWYQSDRNFSDGLSFIMYHPIFNNKLSDVVLLGFKETKVKDFSLGIEQDIYTPTNTATDSIDDKDRPYAGLLYFNYAKYTNNIFRAMSIESHLYLGIIGQYAQGEEMQNGVHKLLNNARANGWGNQLGSGLILDYDFIFRQLLPFNYNFFEFSYFAQAHVGSILNFLEGGLILRIGHFNDAFLNDAGIYNYRNKNTNFYKENDYQRLSKAKKQQIPKRLRKQPISSQIAYLNTRQKREFQLYLETEIRYAHTFYDGTIEGSLIPFESSVYTVPSNNEAALVIGQYGIHMQINRFHFQFNRFLENDVYSTNDYFGYGEIELGWVF